MTSRSTAFARYALISQRFREQHQNQSNCDLHYSMHKPSDDIMNLLSKLGVEELPTLSTYSDVVGLKNALAKVNMFTPEKIS
jgi:hypothetical protein